MPAPSALLVAEVPFWLSAKAASQSCKVLQFLSDPALAEDGVRLNWLHAYHLQLPPMHPFQRHQGSQMPCLVPQGMLSRCPGVSRRLILYVTVVALYAALALSLRHETKKQLDVALLPRPDWACGLGILAAMTWTLLTAIHAGTAPSGFSSTHTTPYFPFPVDILPIV